MWSVNEDVKQEAVDLYDYLLDLCGTCHCLVCCPEVWQNVSVDLNFLLFPECAKCNGQALARMFYVDVACWFI